MNGLAPTQTGGCLCGAVRFTLAAAPSEFGACHCGMCRKMSGGVQMGFQVPAEGARFDGEENIATYQSSEWAERGFCRICGSNLFWRLTAGGPLHGMMNICAGALDSLEGLTLDTEVYIDHKPAAYAFAGPTRQMTQADVMAMVAAAGYDETGHTNDD